MTKVNFFKRIWLSLTDFRIYPFSQKEKTGKAIWFLLRLILLCSFIIAIFMTKSVFDALPGIIAKTSDVLPDFSISNGELITDEQKFTEINSSTYLVFTNKSTSEEILNLINAVKQDKNANKDYVGYIFVLKDQASYVYDLDGAIYQAVKVDYINEIDTSKDEIINDLTTLEESFVAKLIVLLFFLTVFALITLINRITTILIYFITIWLLNTIFVLKLKFRNYIILVCYVSVLPVILETIAIIVTKQISGPVNLICTLVSFVYMFYGLRAIKIDNILTNGTGKNPLEKLENAIKEAQEEIEEQLKEKAEKKKEENEKQDKEEAEDDKKDV
ncbi:MAG: DUF1189 family protein [Clostridia bacterium]|nr:DUF1189 family protein [Clostridia bacterium]